jgi:hypothetical protein
LNAEVVSALTTEGPASAAAAAIATAAVIVRMRWAVGVMSTEDAG